MAVGQVNVPRVSESRDGIGWDSRVASEALCVWRKEADLSGDPCSAHSPLHNSDIGRSAILLRVRDSDPSGRTPHSAHRT
ncbi:MAG: hypothetical protein LZF60_370027 [Nitrospira sp.]|nr:MAG: hypothetical protein LZF60_370027 [Nitrospira sp.]